MIFVKGLMLGLASGVVCAGYCGPILVPYLLSRGETILKNLATIVLFMGGRLAGYLIFAVIAWAAGTAAANITNEKAVIGGIYIVLAVLMIIYGFKKAGGECAGKKATSFFERLRLLRLRSLRSPSARNDILSTLNNQTIFAVILGLLTGLNLCPPFLIAFTEGTQAGSIWASMLYFTAFFVGTSVYILPMAVIGLGRRIEALRYAGRLAAGVMGVYYLYLGITTLYGYFA